MTSSHILTNRLHVEVKFATVLFDQWECVIQQGDECTSLIILFYDSTKVYDISNQIFYADTEIIKQSC